MQKWYEQNGNANMLAGSKEKLKKEQLRLGYSDHRNDDSWIRIEVLWEDWMMMIDHDLAVDLSAELTSADISWVDKIKSPAGS